MTPRNKGHFSAILAGWILVQVYMHISKVQSTYFCELFCMTLCNLALLMFCFLLEIWCRFQFSPSRLTSWNASYQILQNADRDTLKISVSPLSLCPQSCPQRPHDESRHTSVEALLWRWTLCDEFFPESPNFLNYYHYPFPIWVIRWTGRGEILLKKSGQKARRPRMD